MEETDPFGRCYQYRTEKTGIQMKVLMFGSNFQLTDS
jgi:hypothetical protein